MSPSTSEPPPSPLPSSSPQPINIRHVLHASRSHADRNIAVLDHISTTLSSNQTTPPQPPQPSPTSPISKHILTALFAELACPDSQDNYVSIQHHQENEFLYGLVLPVIARLLAVSCPGVLCIVQLPRPEAVPEWAAPASWEGSNESGSKSVGHTTPSRHETSRTPSPSDEGVVPRKSLSPEAGGRTAELIRHADRILSGSEKRPASGSPPPDLDGRALPFVCNGFEVLTGKMPPPKCNMGFFTLASVGWEKAGVVSPEEEGKGVMMGFSNGMMTSTEGIVVTFSNGSLCYLTLRDPLGSLEALKVADGTPVIVFSFKNNGGVCLEQLMKGEGGGEEEVKLRELVKKKNYFFVEIGKEEGNPLSKGLDEQGREKSVNGEEKVSLGPSNEGQHACALEQQKLPSNLPKCPPVTIDAVPRAVPLFVNTINQTFIDPPYYDVPETAYENQLLNDRYRHARHGVELRKAGRSVSVPLSTDPGGSFDGRRQRESSSSAREGGATLQKPGAIVDIDEQRTNMLREGKGHLPANGDDLDKNRGTLRASPKTHPLLGTALHCAAKKQKLAGSPCPSPMVRIGTTKAKSPEPVQRTHPLPSMYNYYGYGHGHGGHIYHPGSSPQVHSMPSQCHTPVGLSANIHQPQPHPVNGSHPTRYYHHPIQTNPIGPQPPNNGHAPYHHPHNRHHPAPHHPYFSVPIPPGLVHSPDQPQNTSAWHRGVPPHRVPLQPSALPAPHLIDARRDMPIHFSSHRAVTTGQYPPSQYFPGPSHPGHLYSSQPNGFKSGIGMIPNKPQPNAVGGNDLMNAHALPNGIHAAVSALGMPNSRCGPLKGVAGIPRMEADRPSATKRMRETMNDVLTSGKVAPSRNDSQSTDKENALHALIQMREGVRKEDTAEAQQDKQNRYDSGDTHNISPGRDRTENEAGAMLNGRWSSGSGRRHSSGTNSSASTNSQGAGLVQGSMTGNSHAPGPGYSGSQAAIKKARKQ